MGTTEGMCIDGKSLCPDDKGGHFRGVYEDAEGDLEVTADWYI